MSEDYDTRSDMYMFRKKNNFPNNPVVYYKQNI